MGSETGAQTSKVAGLPTTCCGLVRQAAAPRRGKRRPLQVLGISSLKANLNYKYGLLTDKATLRPRAERDLTLGEEANSLWHRVERINLILWHTP